MTGGFRYDDLIAPSARPASSPVAPPAGRTFAGQLNRSLALADLGPQPVMIAAVREVLSRLRTSEERSALLEAVAADPAEALRSTMVRYRLGGPLRQLVQRALAVQAAAESDHWLARR